MFMMPLTIAIAYAQAECSTCHDQARQIQGTAHAGVACLDCHPRHQEFPHPSGIPKPACAGCHAEVASRNRMGVHGRARAAGNAAAPDCAVCHGDVHRVQRTGTAQFRKSIPGICGACHDNVLTAYEQSVHGKAVARGVVAAPVCSSCHGEHQIQPPANRASPVNPAHVPETCGRCHADVRLAERFNLPSDVLVSFENSFHGLALQAGSETVANCASCHGVHDILPSSDPRSTINAANLPHTCGKCHPGAGARFAIGRIHWVEGQSEPAPVRWVRETYAFLIPFLGALMLLHNGGDWVRKLVGWRLRPPYAGAAAVMARTPDRFRMYGFERIQHGVLVVAFTVLVWSGFALKYPHAWWAAPLTTWESHWRVRGAIHRTAGVILISLSLLHLVSLLRSGRLRQHWKTLWPQRRDASEAARGLAYNLGLARRRPVVSSHSYVEKLEYWAVIWGTVLMSITGIMLWANTLVITWFTKVMLDVVTAIHFYEAVLATLAIVIWHFYSVIFDPEVYPMDSAWLTGYSVRRRPSAEGEEPAGDPPAKGG